MSSIDRRLFIDNFLSYVKYDTQSSEESETYPSTMKQLDLSKKLLEEVKELGLKDCELTEHGYVFATLPSNVAKR
jgi:tripeptide aminopeptidase